MRTFTQYWVFQHSTSVIVYLLKLKGIDVMNKSLLLAVLSSPILFACATYEPVDTVGTSNSETSPNAFVSEQWMPKRHRGRGVDCPPPDVVIRVAREGGLWEPTFEGGSAVFLREWRQVVVDLDDEGWVTDVECFYKGRRDGQSFFYHIIWNDRQDATQVAISEFEGWTKSLGNPRRYTCSVDSSSQVDDEDLRNGVPPREMCAWNRLN